MLPTCLLIFLPSLSRIRSFTSTFLYGASSLDECGDRHQRIEPASRLVDSFADEVCREEIRIEVFFVFKRIMSLCERHCSAVEPAVHNLRDPGHRLAAHRAGQMHVIHIRSVQFDIFCRYPPVAFSASSALLPMHSR